MTNHEFYFGDVDTLCEIGVKRNSLTGQIVIERGFGMQAKPVAIFDDVKDYRAWLMREVSTK